MSPAVRSRRLSVVIESGRWVIILVANKRVVSGGGRAAIGLPASMVSSGALPLKSIECWGGERFICPSHFL